jgi:hypothetical protein
MKFTLRTLLAVALLFVAVRLYGADRWSTDETAIRMGVQTWFSLWENPLAAPDAQSIKNLYAVTPSTQRPSTVPSGRRTPAEQVTVEVHGNRGVSTFRLPSQDAALVVLTWERRDGLWRIVQETVAGTDSSSERVALSETLRK